ncbi:MAG: type II secretion system F family protein, partial [Methylophilus sp.]
MAAKTVKQITYLWEGKDKKGKVLKGEVRASGEAVVKATLRRQGINVSKVKKQSSFANKGKVTDKDVTLFTRQLATMMRAGVPLLQTFDIVGKGHPNPAVARLLGDIKSDVETGSSLSAAFRKYPLYFDNLFCNLVGAGEQAGILDSLLDRLATYKEKILAIKSKIKSALIYPASIISVAIIITVIIMIFVIPAFKDLFSGFGADLPTPTLIVMAMSDFVVNWWLELFGSVFLGIWFFFYTWKRSEKMQHTMDRLILKAPIFGELIKKATIARFARTLSTMFAA